MRKLLFLSHSWDYDILGRDNHERVGQLYTILNQMGWSCWFDKYDMGINMDACMVKGIEESEVFIICLTKSYCNKINRASYNMRSRSNCLKEWNYAHGRNKFIIVIIMEPLEVWPRGIVTMYLSGLLYIDGSANNLLESAKKLNEMLIQNNIIKQSNKLKWRLPLYTIYIKRYPTKKKILSNQRSNKKDNNIKTHIKI